MAETNAQRSSQRRAHEGQTGYPLWYRILRIQKNTQFGLDQAVHDLQPCRSTLQHWIMARIHPPYEQQTEPRQLIGRDQLLLAIYMTAYPDAEIEECAAYILNNGGGLYSTSTIRRRMQALRLTRTKRASMEAYQAFRPSNILRRDQFFGLPPPLGVNGIERRRLIDVNECSISIEQHTNHTRSASGRRGAHTTIRMRKPGHYVKGKKLTVIFFF
jgi:hypothetical protein